MTDQLRCSFCGKPKDETRTFISGPSVYICNKCVALCGEILAEEDEKEGIIRNPLQMADEIGVDMKSVRRKLRGLKPNNLAELNTGIGELMQEAMKEAFNRRIDELTSERAAAMSVMDSRKQDLLQAEDRVREAVAIVAGYSEKLDEARKWLDQKPAIPVGK